jgi:hypothetical protein
MREPKIKNMTLPSEEADRQRPSNVIDLMDALRKSPGADACSGKKPPKSEKEAPRRGIGLVKGTGQVRNEAQVGVRINGGRCLHFAFRHPRLCGSNITFRQLRHQMVWVCEKDL